MAKNNTPEPESSEQNAEAGAAAEKTTAGPQPEAEMLEPETTPPESAAAAAAPEESQTLHDEDASPTDALKEQLLRMAADFENFRKRAAREKTELRRFAAERVLDDFLPVLDNLQRALEHAQADDPVAEGVRMVAKQFVDTLGQHGVTGFDSIGQVFDPERHEAMSQVPSAEAEPGTVLHEVQKGYMLHDRLLRPAKVVVALPPPETPAA